MNRLLLAPALALCLTGCTEMLAVAGGALAGGGARAPQAVQTATAPLARVTFDESAYRTALAGANSLRLSINVIIARGGLVRNSPSALRVRQGLVALRDSLRAARTLLDALNSPATSLSLAELERKADEYRAAMAAAAAAAEEIGEALSDRTSANETPRIDAAVAEVRSAATDVAAEIAAR